MSLLLIAASLDAVDEDPFPHAPPNGALDSAVGCRPPTYLESSVGTDPHRADDVAPLARSSSPSKSLHSGPS